MFPATLAQVAERVGGRVVGTGTFRVDTIRGIEAAGPRDLTFLRDARSVDRAVASAAGAFLVGKALDLPRPQVVVRDPVEALGVLLSAIRDAAPRPPAGVHPTAIVAADARLGADVSLGAYVVVGAGAEIGARTILHPHVVVGPGARLGPDSELQSHVVIGARVTCGARLRVDCHSAIGSEGFTVRVLADRLVQVPQIGTVELGDDVDLGACVTVDRATLDATRLGHGVKVDNHSHIAHNVVVGDHTLLVAYAKLAGSTRLGAHVVVAEDVGITDNVVIGDRCRIGGGSRVFTSLPAGTEVWGHPARPLAEERKIQAIIARLPELREQVRALARGLGKVKEKGRANGEAKGKVESKGKGKRATRGRG